MSSSKRRRKSWEDKLNDAKDLPKVVQLKGKAKRRWNVETLAIASPREIFSFIQRVPAGKVATISDLQAAVAKKHAADMGCPLTTGIFTWIAAQRILKSDGSLNPKFPGGIERQAKRLAKEGVASEKHGVKALVVGVDDIRYHF